MSTLKELGNAAYKQRDFKSALDLYDQAWQHDKDITCLNNKSAVYYEMGDYKNSITTAQQAVDQGRQLRQDYKLIAKSFARIGTAHIKLNDLSNAIIAFQRSLTEHRTPQVLQKLKSAEKEQSEQIKLAYIDPVLADQAREQGNVHFKSGDFASSVASYAESIKRNPNDARGYTNRAAALTKLMALPEALKDCDKAIQVDPAFIKGYIRKSHVLYAMKEFTKSLTSIELAANLDTTRKHSSEINSQTRKVALALSTERAGESEEESYARAMRDPEIQSIMSDPIVRNILEQAQREPGSLEGHMGNEQVREKIMKLVKAGIIQTRSR